MTKEQEEAIEMLEDIKNNSWTTKYIMSSDSAKAETVLNMLKEKDKEIQDLKQALARNIAKNVTSSMKESAKSKDDLEMLNKGWQIELEKKDRQINSKNGTINALQCALKERTEERDRKDDIITKQDNRFNGKIY